jgi:hypothetical protein
MKRRHFRRRLNSERKTRKGCEDVQRPTEIAANVYTLLT